MGTTIVTDDQIRGIREAMEKANTMLTGYGANNTNFLRQAINQLNLVANNIARAERLAEQTRDILRGTN